MLEAFIMTGQGLAPFVPPPILDSSVYKGFVPSNSLIGGNALASLVGLSSGKAINDSAGWLHYIDGDMEFYIPRKPFRAGMTVAALLAAGGRTGTQVQIGADQYTVRLMTGMANDAFSSIISVPGGGEWDKYMYPIYKKETGRPAGALWAEYARADLGMTNVMLPSEATASVCYETHATINTALAARGHDYQGGTSIPGIERRTIINDAAPNEGNGSVGVNAYGWRPMLIKIQPPPVLVDTWENVGPMPVQRSRYSAVEIGGLVYLYGGYNEASVPQGTLHSFNPATKVFTALASGQPRGFHDAVAINGKMYVFGGIDGSGTAYTNTVQVYDPVANTWSLPSVSGSVATVRARHKMIADGTGFIVIGGLTTGGGQVSSLQRFETSNNTWAATYGSYGNTLFGAVDYDSTITYITGGYAGVPIANVNTLTKATGATVARQALPSTRYGHVSFYMKAGLYVVGGVAGTPADSTKVMKYTPGTNTWATLGTIPYTVGENAVSVKVGADMYIFGGNGASGAFAWKYTP